VWGALAARRRREQILGVPVPQMEPDSMLERVVALKVRE
jgi:hypothetical protein